MAEAEDLDGLLYTPTWAVAAVCAIFILCSLAVERAIFFIGHVLRNHNQAALSAALEKIKEELMVVGFISLALTVGGESITHICVPMSWVNFMPQCTRLTGQEMPASETSFEETSSVCPKGKTPIIRMEGLHQLHVLLFTLAVVHVIYSIIIMALGMWKVHQWKHWEERAHIEESFRDHGQIRLTKDASFIKRHASNWSKNWLLANVAAFFQQFVSSVTETDYRTLRHGFIKKHMLKSFNFHNYIWRTMEDDFKHVVGISFYLWGYFVLLTLLNVHGWGIYYWSSFIPLIIVLAVGTKLRYIITRMAVHCSEKHAVVLGLPDVKPADEFFWFKSPQLILYFIHYILFQDALELALVMWNRFEFSESNCLYMHRALLLGRLVLGVLAQVICGYVMLPIYALVSQMGSEMKRGVGDGNAHLQMTSLILQEEQVQSDSREAEPKVLETGKSLGVAQETNTKQLCLQGVDLEKQWSGDSATEDSKEVDDVDDEQGVNVAPLQKRMSFIQRVAQGVHGADYITLASPTSSEKTS